MVKWGKPSDDEDDDDDGVDDSDGGVWREARLKPE